MADSYVNYAFLPWVRQGLSRFISAEDAGQVDADVSARLPVKLRLNDAPLIEKTIRVMGPGDVVGLEAAQVIRREPERGSKSFIPNYFVSIEFRSPDLPWLFTPLKPDNLNRLRPWLCLVVVRKQDGVTLTSASRDSVSRLSIASPAKLNKELPPLDESWAWAHTQVTLTQDDQRPVEQILAESPELVISRLLSPRRLEPKTSYYALVVPCFKAGVAAALGLDPVMDLSPAWTQDLSSVTLPVYDSWEFTTGLKGDFEALVRLLKPQHVSEGVGKRPLNISNPRWGDPKTFGVPEPEDGKPARVMTQIEGALRAPLQSRADLPDEVKDSYPARLATIVNRNTALEGDDDDPDPIVAPPMYGRWHAGLDTLPERGNHWIKDLNMDPRDRSVAGIGTQVVQRFQESLMHSAWSQVDRITQANTVLRRGKVAEAVGVAFKEKHFDSMSAAEIIEMTSFVHSQLLMSSVTLQKKITVSSLPDTAVSAAFRRIKRPGGPLVRALDVREGVEVLQRLNSGNLKAAQPHTAYSGTFTGNVFAKASLPEFWPISLLQLLPISGWIWSLLTIVFATVAVLKSTLVAAILIAVSGAALSVYGFNNAKRWRRALNLLSGKMTGKELEKITIDPQFRLSNTDLEQSQLTDDEEKRNVTLFHKAAVRRQDSLTRINELLAPLPVPEPVVINDIAETLRLRLDPKLHARHRFADRVTRPPTQEPDDPLDDIMVYPEFDTPMYEALRDVDQDFVLPGLQHVRTNTITILETNRRFIEAFMVGINHEMSRELRWREYPTDQRGSYFRQFWDPRGRTPPALTKQLVDARRDIKEVHTWKTNETLGLAGLSEGGEAQKLVLLIRGELLRRFPTAQIYAQAARFEGSGERTLGTEIRHPLFRGSLKPDVHFMGFDLDFDEAFGSVEQSENRPGWFFVIQQQPTEPRFGLDVATEFADTLPQITNWNDLSWGHFTNDAQSLAALSYLSPKTNLNVGNIGPNGIDWGNDAASNAYITLQKPVRVAIHADDMLHKENDNG